ncbi:hypothetical protein V3C99_008040 [Haemonchus contortus]|uniref:Amastin surface glycofamily protein n=1 Tax=Haemonchus contortus TaxID=6289 RepID=A0A7I5EB39_HAECO
MCFSMCAQVLYGVIMFVCLLLTLGAMFTSSWRKIGDELQENALKGHLPDHMGIFPFACRMPGGNTTSPTNSTGLEYCEKWWNDLQTWEKVVIGAMVLAVLFEVIALIWNAFTWCACCCKQFLLHPLTLAAVATSISLATAVVVYGLRNQEAFQGIENWKDIESKIKSEVGYSFWLAVGAMVLAIADVIVGACAACMGESCL